MTLETSMKCPGMVESLPFYKGECLWKTNRSLCSIRAINTLFNKDIIGAFVNYIAAFGRIILEKFQRTIKFITKMASRQTIGLKILSAYISPNTEEYTICKRNFSIKSVNWVLKFLFEKKECGTCSTNVKTSIQKIPSCFGMKDRRGAEYV